MRTNRPVLCGAQWLIPDTESVDALVEAVLYEQAWWIAAQSGKHAHRGMVWAEGSGRPHRRPVVREAWPLAVPAAGDTDA